MKDKYKRICRNPDCKKEFVASFHTQRYCSPACRLSNFKSYKYNTIDRPYEPPIDEFNGNFKRYVCPNCHSPLSLQYTDEGHKLYLVCTKPYCKEKIDFDRYLNEGRASKKVIKELIR